MKGSFNVKEELMKRYLYLYENKELILSVCIDKAIEKEYYEKRLKDIRKIRRNVKKYNKETNESLMKLIDMSEKTYKELLKVPIYYLFDRVNDNIISMFEEFLFTDEEIERTFLYKYIEETKANDKYLEEAYKKIDGLNRRRNSNMLLRDKSPFTVWRILTYVRNRNKHNKAILDALDKYYNIERYMMTGINFESGYFLLESLEELYNNNSCNDDVIGVVSTSYEHSAVIFRDRGNEFEKEDDYYDVDFLDGLEESKFYNSITLFGEKLAKGELLSVGEKNYLYNKLVNSSSKKLVLSDNSKY